MIFCICRSISIDVTATSTSIVSLWSDRLLGSSLGLFKGMEEGVMPTKSRGEGSFGGGSWAAFSAITSATRWSLMFCTS